MRLITTVNPENFRARTKHELMVKMTVGLHQTFSRQKGYAFSGWSDGKKYKYAMNFEKRKRKMERFGKNGRKLKKPRVKQEKEWIGRRYKFDIDFPIQITQHARYFDFKY